MRYQPSAVLDCCQREPAGTWNSDDDLIAKPRSRAVLMLGNLPPGDSPKPVRSGIPLAGLDSVRTLALGLVFLQHTLTHLDLERLTTLKGLSPGQLGVSLFLMASGLLASASNRTPLDWLIRRLRRMYPALWITLAVSFPLAWISGHKDFSAGQVVSQFLGTGLYTHDDLVNSATWFTSLILVCYLGTFLIHALRHPGMIGGLISLTLCVLVAIDEQPWLLSHLLTYAIAASISEIESQRIRRLISLLTAVCLMILAIAVQPAYAYAGVSLILVKLLRFLRSDPAMVTSVARYSYEFYLVHGIVMVGCFRLLRNQPLLSVVTCLVLSAAASVVLSRTAAALDHWMSRVAPFIGRRRVPACPAEDPALR